MTGIYRIKRNVFFLMSGPTYSSRALTPKCDEILLVTENVITEDIKFCDDTNFVKVLYRGTIMFINRQHVTDMIYLAKI